MTRKSKGITALSVVNSIIEFAAMTSDRSQWSLEKQKSNLPRLIRLQRIESLIHAFIPELKTGLSIKIKIEQVISGEFILLKHIDAYKALEGETIKELNNSRFSLLEKENVKIDSIGYSFARLFQYKTLLNSLLDFNRSILEISYPHVLPIVIADSVSEQIDSSKLDNFLTIMISPEGKSFSESDLIKNYHFPQEDLFDIDLDWM